MTEYHSKSQHLTKSNEESELAKHVATELLVIWADLWLQTHCKQGYDKEGFYMTRRFGLIVASAVCRSLALNRLTAIFRDLKICFSCVFFMSRFGVSNQLRQFSLL